MSQSVVKVMGAAKKMSVHFFFSFCADIACCRQGRGRQRAGSTPSPHC